MINASLPFNFEPSGHWLGDDGSWSTFAVRVGTPPQEFRLLPATNVQETWIPLPQACASYDSTDCPSLRGVANDSRSRGFEKNQSSTWKEEGIYNLVSEQNLGYAGNGDYGFDTVQLGNHTQGGPKLDHQVVAGIVEDDFYLGIVGLGPKPANFSGYNDPQPSLLRTLVDKKMIPSLSYGYTAGAKYRLNGTHGSLTLGGYDTSRFVPNYMPMTFASDDSRSLTVGLQSINANNTLLGSVTPLSDGIYALIDSTVPHIWLPKAACDVFERAFGLMYDNSTDLYLVNDTTHAQLQECNPTVTFVIGNDIAEGTAMSFELPYAAFDLEASYPIYPKSKKYFPLRRAANDTQYTLGRTFLQETYIIVDNERQNFTVAQALFDSPKSPVHIVPIHPPSDNSSSPIETHPQSSAPRLSTGIIVAIATLSTIFLAILTLVILGVYRRYRRTRDLDEVNSSARGKDGKTWQKASRKSSTRRWVHELDAGPLNNKSHGHLSMMEQHPAWRNARWNGAGIEKPPLTYIRRQELAGTSAAAELEARRRDRQGPWTANSGKAPWSKFAGKDGDGEREVYEMPGHEVRSKRGSTRSWRSKKVG